MLTLATLGYGDGLRFAALEGNQDLFFPVISGPWLKQMRLVLPYSASAAAPGRRTLTVTVDGRIIQQVALANADGTLDMPVPLDAIRDGTVRVRLDYSGGDTPDRCFDRRTAADRLLIAPGGGLALEIDQAARLPVGVAAALMPKDPLVILPSRPTEQQAAAALTVAAARSGAQLVAAGSAAAEAGRASVIIESGNGPALRSMGNGDSIVLGIGGSSPDTAARAAFSGPATLMMDSVVTKASVEPQRPERLRFSDLGADPRPIDVAETGGWVFALPASRLPAGQSVSGFAIDVTAVPDGTGRPAIASAWMNGTLLGSTALKDNGPTRLQVAVPDGLARTINGVEVRITREMRADCGDRPRGWPAQLLGSSEVLTTPSQAKSDFSDFAAALGDGVTVVVPNPQSLAIAARAIAGLVGPTVPIRVSYGTIPTSGPVVFVGTDAPAGATSLLTQNGGQLSLAGGKGGEHFSVPYSSAMTTVQLLEADGRSVLWIKPAASGASPKAMWLSRGNVAFVAQDGNVTAFTTARDRLEDVQAPRPVEENRPWSKWWWIGLGGLLAAAIALWSFRPSVKRAKPGQSQ